MRRTPLSAALSAAILLGAGAASAQYQLRADAYASAAAPSSGMLVLSAAAHDPQLPPRSGQCPSSALYPKDSWLDADAVVWLGAGGGADPRGDVMVAAVRVHHPCGWGEIKLGRMLETAGGLRPVHLDGGSVVARAPWGTSVEIFGGSQVVPFISQDLTGHDTGLTTREFNWVLGGRVSQRITAGGRTWATLGVGYLQMREAGVKAYEELGMDATFTPISTANGSLDAAFSGAMDLLTPTLADARVSLAGRIRSLRIEAFATKRSPAHLLPATSLFSALGDIPSERAGGSILWRAAPRLDLLGEASVEALDGGPTDADPKATVGGTPRYSGSQGMFRATLRLDDRGEGALGLELRRNSVPAATGLQTVSWSGKGASWTGVRGTARIPICRTFFAASTELELVRPDEANGRGALWPWGLVGLTFNTDRNTQCLAQKPERKAHHLELAAAIEAGASPTSVSAVTGLFRLSYAWSPRSSNK
jgi:hypothetical protein